LPSGFYSHPSRSFDARERLKRSLAAAHADPLKFGSPLKDVPDAPTPRVDHRPPAISLNFQIDRISPQALLRLLPEQVKLLDRILIVLKQQPGRVVLWTEITEAVWGVHADGSARTDGGPEFDRSCLNSMVVRLRAAGHKIVTHKTRGLQYAGE
jgi:hypothetical protein